MDERVVQFRVGVMVLAVTIIAGILVLLFDKLPVFGPGTYTIYVTFTRAPGVALDTPVRKNGILIGRVTDIGLREEDVLVTTAIDRKVNRSEVKLRRNEICTISGSLLGDKSLEFVTGADPELPKTLLVDGDTVEGIVASDPLAVIGNLEGGLSQAVTEVTSASVQISRLARRLTEVLDKNGDQFQRILATTEQTLEGLRSTVGSADQLLSDPEFKANLKQAVNEMPGVLADAREALESLKETMGGVDRNLTNIEGFTKPLGERGEHLINNVERATGKLDRVLGQLVTFSERLNDPNGTLGQLLHNPDLYQKLDETITNINRISRELIPVIRDARVFADKIARHPESLGVGGALRRGTGAK